MAARLRVEDVVEGDDGAVLSPSQPTKDGVIDVAQGSERRAAPAAAR